MSSRIFGPGAGEVERFTWRRINGGKAGEEERPEDGQPAMDTADAAEPEPFVPEPVPEPVPDPVPGLEAAIAALEAELSRTSAQIPLVEQQARNEGYNSGFRAGEISGAQKAKQQAAQEFEQIMLKASSSIEEWVHFRVRIRQQLEHDLVRLATSIARRIVRRELTVDPDALNGIVKAAVAKTDAREIHRLVVATADAPVVQKRLAELSLPLRVEVAADSALPRGSLILETSRGQLDASVETQLEEIDRGLADLVRRSA